MEATDTPADEHPTQTFHVKLDGTGLSLERDVDQRTALDIMTLIMGGQIGAASISGRAGSGSKDEKANPSATVGEFIADSGARSMIDKIVAVAAYMTEYEGVETFTRADIQTQLQLAREPLPKNLSRDVGTAARERLIADRGGGIFAITRTGLDRVARGFSTEARSTPTRRRTRKKAAATAAVGGE